MHLLKTIKKIQCVVTFALRQLQFYQFCNFIYRWGNDFGYAEIKILDIKIPFLNIEYRHRYY